MLVKEFHDVAMNYVFKKFRNHRFLKFDVSAPFPFLKIAELCLLLSTLWGLDQSQLMIGRYHVLLVLGGRHICLETMVECHLVLVI